MAMWKTTYPPDGVHLTKTPNKRTGYVILYWWDPLADKMWAIGEHRYVWYRTHGPIPDGHVIHHKDSNRANNDIANLECIELSTHQLTRHSPNTGLTRREREAIYRKTYWRKLRTDPERHQAYLAKMAEWRATHPPATPKEARAAYNRKYREKIKADPERYRNELAKARESTRRWRLKI